MSGRILFGDDGSTCSDSAWLWINSHDWPGWTVDVLRAVDGITAPDVAIPRVLLRPDVADGMTEITVQQDPRYALHTRGGDYDLITIGSKGRGLMKALRIGSTAEWLMQMPPAPMVIVRSGHRTERILLAHDGSVHATAVERAILNLPWSTDVEVLVLTVFDGRCDAQHIADASALRLEGLVKAVDVSVLGPDELQVFYRPRDIILEAIDRWHPDLVAIGGRGMSRWAKLNETTLHRAGSTANAVATHAPCSVLIARHPE